MIKRLLTLVVIIGFFSPAYAEKAPDWVLQDAQGNEVNFADFRGNSLILHFWATWCPYCKKLQPGLDRLYIKYREQGLQLIAISWREDEGAEPQKLLDTRGYHFKTLVNGDDVAKLYGVKGTPTTYFIGREGDIKLRTQTSDPNDPILEETVKSIVSAN